MAPIQGKPLILYTATPERYLGAMLAQCNDEGKEHFLYYINRTMVDAEVNSTKKIYHALVFVIQKLRHYLFACQIIVILKASD